jgi:cob(I)alamin adenosyltransferase
MRTPLIVLYTGNGKGKTTAALGLVMRALGHDGRCAVIQFIKMDSLDTGEKREALRLGVAWRNFGEGFTWNNPDPGPTVLACQNGWDQAKEWITSGMFDLVVLDEFTYALTEHYLPQNDVLDWLLTHKNDHDFPHIVITGRNAPVRLVEIADLVSEVVEVKHPWSVSGVKAQKMIEF